MTYTLLKGGFRLNSAAETGKDQFRQMRFPAPKLSGLDSSEKVMFKERKHCFLFDIKKYLWKYLYC